MKATDVLKRFNDTISDWIRFLDDYTLSQLQQVPGPGSWSLGQVYTHIIDDTRYQVAQMKLALGTTAYAESAMHVDAMKMFANNSFPDMQIQGPATDQLIRQPDSKQEVMQGLVQIRNEVNDAWEGVDAAAAIGKSLHPGLLYFSAMEWVQFMEMHLRHHIKQQQRIDAIFDK